jgi:DNA-binding transcriptional MerR regulator
MSYTQKGVSKITGLTLRQVGFYVEQGAIFPEDDPGKGRGRVRRYSKRNLLDFLLIKSLFGYGMTVGKIKLILKFLRALEKTGLSNYFLRSREDSFLLIYKKPDGSIKLAFSGPTKEDPSILDPNKMQDFCACIVIKYSDLVRKIDQEG